tara:strand:- start:821 stop:1669 length:849 start_codon:yes stop_codon:yes gene_type:complete
MSIDEICYKYDIRDYTINNDGSIDVDNDDVDLSHMGHKELPLKFNKVYGDFHCGYNDLTSLKGSPKWVGGDFNCIQNNLTDLKGGPEYVGEDLYVARNSLTSLEGSPEKVGGHFSCQYNDKLLSLKGGPKEVIGNYQCQEIGLTSLEGSPEKVGGTFNCYKNKLTSLKGSPEYIGIDFNCSMNKLTSLEGCPKFVGGNIYCCNDNFLMYLKEFPESFNGFISCKGSPLGSLFDEVDIEFLRAFKSFRVLQDDVVNLKRLKYLNGMFNEPININKIKIYYKIK